MRLRRPCEHDRYDSHDVRPLSNNTGIPAYRGTVAPCPGGEFLPEDAELVERIAEVLARQHHLSHPYDTNFVEDAKAVLEALAADQVGEPG